jgi:hypothetical protein
MAFNMMPLVVKFVNALKDLFAKLDRVHHAHLILDTFLIQEVAKLVSANVLAQPPPPIPQPALSVVPNTALMAMPEMLMVAKFVNAFALNPYVDFVLTIFTELMNMDVKNVIALQILALLSLVIYAANTDML